MAYEISKAILGVLVQNIMHGLHAFFNNIMTIM